MRRTVLTLVALAALAATALPLYAQADKPVAVVNGDKIGEQNFVDILKARYGARVLNAMIGNLAIRQAAKAAGITVTQDELERRFGAAQSAIEKQAPITGMNFEYWLASKGLTREYFIGELYDGLLLEKMIKDQVKVTDGQVAEVYQRNREEFSEPATVRVSHICVSSEKEAAAVRADITAGKISWDEAAKKYSLDHWTKDSGGDMGFLPLGQSEIQKAAFVLKKDGEISAPVQSRMGFHILKRVAFREPGILKFEEVQERIREELELRQIRTLSGQKRDAIMAAAKIDVTTQLPTEAMPPAIPTTPAAPATGAAAPKP